MEEININIEIDNKTIEWVKAINRQLNEIAKQEIDFSCMPIKPHITLLMGDIKEENLAKIANIINDSRFRCELKTAEFLPPVIRGKYIFLPVKNNEAFLHDNQKLLVLLDGLIVPNKHKLSKTNPAHITLGYTRQPQKLKNFVKTITPPAPARLDQIVISRTRDHGVVFVGEY